MFDSCPQPETPDEADALPPAPVRAEERMRLARRMAEFGARIGETLTWQAEHSAHMLRMESLPAHLYEHHTHRLDETARTFAQVSRAVSLALALEERIDQNLKATPPLDEAEQARERRRRAAMDKRDRARARLKTVQDAVEAVAGQELPEPGEAPRRTADLTATVDRMVAVAYPDIDSFLNRPEGEIIARICKDLGFRPDWTSWNDPWADEAMYASAALGNLRRQHWERRKQNPSPAKEEGSGWGRLPADEDAPLKRTGSSPPACRRGSGPHPQSPPFPIEGEGFG